MPTISRPKRVQKKTGDFYDTERRKIYNSERWRRLRAWKFACNPLCEVSIAKLLQKSEMRKDIVIELSYKGFG